MAFIFSKGCGYAIQAILYIAIRGEKRIGGKEIAEKLGIPAHFLSKILQSLTEQGILDSQKGASGGFSLGKPKANIKLLDIVQAIDGLDVLNQCVLGFPGCGDDSTPCFMHGRWGSIREEIQKMLSEDTIEDLIRLSQEGHRIAGIPSLQIET